MKSFLRHVVESRSPEARLKRVSQHSNTRNIGIISAQRSENQSPEEFRLRHRELAHDIRQHGFGYLRVRGASQESSESGNDIHVKGEHSYLIIGDKKDDSGRLKGFLRKHGEKYKQDSVLYKQFDKPNAVWIGTSKTAGDPPYYQEKDIGPFHPKQIGKYFSKIVKGSKDFTYSNQNEELEFFTREAKLYRLEHRVYSLDEVVSIINGEPQDEADRQLMREGKW